MQKSNRISTKPKNLKDYKILKFYDANRERYSFEYYAEFKKACDKFFKFMENESPKTNIILNLSKFTYKYWSNNKILTKKEFIKTYELNVYKDKLDAYILHNYDVDLLYFDTSIISDEKHVWDVHPTHYESKYYKSATKQINEIIERNKEESDFTKVIKENIRCKTIHNLNNYNDPILITANNVFKDSEIEQELFNFKK